MNPTILRQAAGKHAKAVLPPYDTIMEAGSGFEAICMICDLFGSMNVYIPSKQKIFQKCLESEAIKEFSFSGSYQSVARKYGFSESHIRKLLKASG